MPLERWARPIVLPTLIGVASCLGTAVALRHVVPPPLVPGVTEKLEAVRGAGGAFDVLLIGNSRVLYQLDPDVLDAEVAAAGGPAVRCYNLGVNGMALFEVHYLLRGMLADAARRPRCIVWDVAMRTLPPRRDEGTRRFAYWHGVPETVAAVRYELAGEEARSLRARRAGAHAAAFLQEWSCRGLLVDGAARWFAGVPGHPPKSRRGYMALDDERDPAARAKREAFLRLVREGQWPHRAGVRERGGRDADAVRWLIELTRRHGVPLLLIRSPQGDESSAAVGAETAIDGVPVHRFDDAAAFPALHDPAIYWDVDHLNRDGSRLLSREVAKLIRAELEH